MVFNPNPHTYWINNLEWNWKFAWLPHRCELSNKFIWLKYAYRGIAIINDYPEPVIIRWRTTEEHILKLIQQ